MAPTRSKKRKSTESTSSLDIQSFPAPPQITSTKTDSLSRTPIRRSPVKKATMGITLNQKQALIDNLQLEITERARKLRAQYMLQAQGLRTRIEIRVNRIPMALRRANMGELLLKYDETQRAKHAAARASPAKMNSPSKNLIQAGQSNSRASPSPQRGMKRLSDEVNGQENVDIENPKKRAKAAPQAPERTSRPNVNPAQVLSPRSANSQTLARSPIRPAMSPGKSYLARPVSPLKPTTAAAAPAVAALNTMVERAKSTRGTTGRKAAEPASNATIGAGRGKRTAGATAAPVPPPKVGRGRASTISDSSDTSSGTTVVRKPVVAAKKAPVKKTMMSTLKGMGGGGASKKLPAAKPATAAGTGTRVLRKRT